MLMINQLKQFRKIVKNSDVSLIANIGNVAVLKKLVALTIIIARVVMIIIILELKYKQLR
jgi:hypothetical protein